MDLLSLQLWSIYAAGNTVPIPFLRATDISPIALLSDNVLGGVQHDNRGTVAVETLQELFTGDGQSKKGRRGQNEVPSSCTSLIPCSFISWTPKTFVLFVFRTADASSTQCLSKTYFKSNTIEPRPGFSLPQNVRHHIYCYCYYFCFTSINLKNYQIFGDLVS